MTLNNTTIILAVGLIIFALALSACNNHKKQQEQLQQEVISIHDTVMKKMGTLMERKLTINHILSRLDSLKSTNSELDTAKTRTELTQIREELVSADDQMMTWMHNFNPEYTDKSHEEIMTYLNEQKEKIITVESSFKGVILKSDSVIAEYK